MGNNEPSHQGGPTRKQQHNNAARRAPRDKPWQRTHQPSLVAPRIRGADAASGLQTKHHRPLVPLKPPPEKTIHSFPPGLGESHSCQGVGGSSKPLPRRQARRWIATPNNGENLDLDRLQNARTPLPCNQRTRTFTTGLVESSSTGVLAGSDRGAEKHWSEGGDRARGVEVSPRIERTVRRLSTMEACLRNLEHSMRELQSGEIPVPVLRKNGGWVLRQNYMGLSLLQQHPPRPNNTRAFVECVQ